MLSMQYLQIIVTILVAGEITIRLSKDIYKTRRKQKSREGLLKLNWTIPNVVAGVENKYFPKKYISFTYLRNIDFSSIKISIRDSMSKFSIKAIENIIFTVVLGIILTGSLYCLIIYSFN